LHRDAPDTLPRIYADEEQLAQVVLNLTINAVQAMPEGGAIKLTAHEREGGVEIHVRDEGSGVPSDQMDRIFDPFFTTKDGGTGLGLSVVHQIATQHGGTVKAVRNADRGMTFSVFFPKPGVQR
jgi:signal transduction histidine kinase